MKITRKKIRKLILREMASMRSLGQSEYRAQMFKQNPGLVFGAIADLEDPEVLEYDEYGEEELNPELEQLTFIIQNVDQFCANELMRQLSPTMFVDNVKNSIPVAISIIKNNPEFVTELDAVILYLEKVQTLIQDKQ